MPESSPAQEILKRLIDAEQEARQVLAEAAQRADSTIQQAREEAQKAIDAVRKEAANRVQARIAEIESESAAQLKRRLDEAGRKAGDFELTAAQNLSAAVDFVVGWVTAGQG